MLPIRAPHLAWLWLPLLVGPALAQDAAPAPKPTEKPFLWVIEGREKPSFLYGTFHLPDDRTLALPKVVEEALGLSDAFYAELPEDPAAEMKLQQKMMIPGNKTIKDLIPAELAQRAEALVQKKGLPGLAPLQKLQPWALALQIPFFDYLQDLMSGKKGLDGMLYEKAKKAKKEVGGLETHEEQVSALVTLGEKHGVEMLRQAIDGEEKGAEGGQKPLEKLIAVYLEGDEAKMQAYYDEEQKKSSAEMNAEFVKLLVTDRNHRMAERIAAKLQESPGKSYFFAVGTLHHVGEEGVVALLQKDGLTIRRLTAVDAGKLEPAGAPR